MNFKSFMKAPISYVSKYSSHLATDEETCKKIESLCDKENIKIQRKKLKRQKRRNYQSPNVMNILGSALAVYIRI